MEGVTSEIPDRPAILPFVCAHDSLGGILHNEEMMTVRNPHDGVHFACDARVMDDADHPGFLRDSGFDLLIDVHCVRPDVHKNQLRTGQDKGVRCG